MPRAGKLPFSQAPENEENLPELHLALYNTVIVFDQATKLAYCVAWVHMDRHAGIHEAYLAGKHALAAMSERISPGRTPNLPLGKVWRQLSRRCAHASSAVIQQPMPPSILLGLA